jgi:hypothetical protein
LHRSRTIPLFSTLCDQGGLLSPPGLFFHPCTCTININSETCCHLLPLCGPKGKKK